MLTLHAMISAKGLCPLAVANSAFDQAATGRRCGCMGVIDRYNSAPRGNGGLSHGATGGA
ncbi:hypothetical protein CAter282_3685 [Collimonas arenae]|uniref:Uncharacterized protein n=1 Tax=Collimonas arenae TaxID=279058 RepID=A0A127QMR6_9BURK|nr:hypothetical protein CAter282_3685 [Collimonas arenae]